MSATSEHWEEELPRYMWLALTQWARENGRTGSQNNGFTGYDLAGRALYAMSNAGLLTHAVNINDMTDERQRATFNDIIWDWACQGVIRIHVARSSGFDHLYMVTGYGLDALHADAPEPTPHDPEGYVRSLVEKVGAIDPVALQYLQEGLQTFRHGAMRATMVMLGGASERLLLLLCETLYPAIKTERSVSQVWADVRKEHARLAPADAKAIRSSVGDDWEERLESGFQVIRRSRNEAGHPAIVSEVSQFDARFRFFTFYFYAQTVYGLLKHHGH